MDVVVIILTMLLPYIQIIFWLGIILVIYKIVYKKNKNKQQINNIDMKSYYRDIPCSGNIDLAYWLLYNFSNLKKDDLNNGFIGAYLLKWYKNGYVDIKPSDKDNYAIDLKDGNWDKTDTEKRIYQFLKNVAGNNNTLEKNEIQNYCSVGANDFELVSLFRKILNEIREKLEEKKYIISDSTQSHSILKTQSKTTLSEELVKEYQNLYGLKNFLEDYSNMEEKMHIEVHIWEDYLIFANLLGITDKVKQQFKKIYPQFNTLFEIPLDDIIQRKYHTIYRGMKIQFFVLILCVIAVIVIAILVKMEKVKLVPIIIMFFIIMGIVGFLYKQLSKYLMNKKVKEMNAKTYAKIVEVNVKHDTEYDRSTKETVKTTTYYFNYEYMVNGIKYSGFGSSSLFKIKGQRVKIYYNEMKPEKSETAAKHNYHLKVFIFTILFLIGFFWLINTYIINR